MSLFVDHTDEEEQRACANPVVDHLQNGTRHTLSIEREQTKHHKSEVTDGGIRNQFFDIRLGVGNCRAIDDADGREKRDPRGGLDSRFGKSGMLKRRKP